MNEAQINERIAILVKLINFERNEDKVREYELELAELQVLLADDATEKE
jgi:hypothetical protein